MNEAANPILCLWQCSICPEHRGWRHFSEPRGTCERCLAFTAFEMEVQTPPEGPASRPWAMVPFSNVDGTGQSSVYWR